MDRVRRYNPFAYRDSRSRSEIATYRTLTLASWALAVALSVYYVVRHPKHGYSIPAQNRRHPTAFSLNMVFVYVYWGLLFCSQSSYVGLLLGRHTAEPEEPQDRAAALSVGSHFIANNLLHALFVLIFVRGHFILAELVLLVNWINLTLLYFRHPAAVSQTPRTRALVHLPAVAGPLAWTFLALYWNGAMMLPHHLAHGLAARVLANLFVWSLLVYGMFFVIIYRDYSMGFCLSVLAGTLGVGQFFLQFLALQWIFAFTIMGLLFVGTSLVAVPAWTGYGGESVLVVVDRDAEQAPLLRDDDGAREGA